MAKKTLHKARLLKKTTFKLARLPEVTAYLDTGYSKKETIKRIETMYKNNKRIDVHQATWVLLLFKQIPNKEEENTVGEVRFSTNWNNKLACQCYTTIRLNTEKYKEGSVYLITLGK